MDSISLLPQSVNCAVQLARPVPNPPQIALHATLIVLNIDTSMTINVLKAVPLSLPTLALNVKSAMPSVAHAKTVPPSVSHATLLLSTSSTSVLTAWISVPRVPTLIIKD